MTEKNDEGRHAVTCKYLVYALVDPRDPSQYRYIGQSRTGMARPDCHSSQSHLKVDKNLHKTRWLGNLLNEGLSPLILVLASLKSISELSKVEILNWLNTNEIKLIKESKDLGHPLTNISPGGTGQPIGYSPSAETRLKISNKHKGKVLSSATKARMSKYHSGRSHPSSQASKMWETRRAKYGPSGQDTNKPKPPRSKYVYTTERRLEINKKISTANKGRVHTEAQNRAHGDAVKGIPMPAHVKAILIKSNTGRKRDPEINKKTWDTRRALHGPTGYPPDKLGRKLSEETRANMSRAQKGRAVTMEQMKKMWETRRAKYGTSGLSARHKE